MKKRFLIIASSILILFIIDRYIWMPERVKNSWSMESGRNLGDPLAYEQDFTLVRNKIIFKNSKSKEAYPAVYENRQSEFYLLGCYIGSLYIYDIKRDEIIKYIRY